jgi:nucleotide-binding universal stress UspA family protein
VSRAHARSIPPGRPANDLLPAEDAGLVALPLPLRPRRVIAAVDFTPAGERARSVATAVARASGAVLDLVHVLDAFDQIFVRRRPDLLAEPRAVMDGIDVALRSRARAARAAGVTCVVTALVGAPGLELGRHAARTGADMVAIGTPAGDDDRSRAGWGARAMQQLLRIPRWRGLIVQVRGPAGDLEPGDGDGDQSSSADRISPIQYPVKPRLA